MIGVRLVALVTLLFLNSLVPGFLLVRRLGFRPLETLCASVGASLALVYLLAFGLYVSGAPLVCGAAGSVFAAGLAVVHRDALARFLRIPSVRRVAVAFLALLAWTLAFVGLVRHFGGGGWGSDWLEHFHRCLYFLHRLPPDVMLTGKAHLAARPPLMNLVAAYFLAQSGDGFEDFQVVFAFLSVLPFLACALIVGRLRERGARGRRAIAPFLALCPLFVTNVTYTWTKLLSAFFVIVALHFYLATLRRSHDRARAAAWPLALAGALLVHYSAGAFAVFMVGHHLLRVLRDPPARWPARLGPAVPGVLLLATWLAFALASFGIGRTVASNSSVGDARDYSAAGNLAKVAQNVVDTVVPHPLRGVAPFPAASARRLGEIRDYFFLVYQTNALAAVGSVGGVVAVGLLLRALRSGSAETRFWRAFLPFVLVAGVATHGGRDLYGVAHVTLQPLVLLGVTFVASAWTSLGRIARAALLMGALADFGLGIALHHHVESLENTAEHQFFDPDVRAGPEGFEWRREGALPSTDWHGWFAKHAPLLVDAQLERARRLPPDRARRVVDAVAPEAERLERLDASDWGGWWRRHGRELTFVGDHLASVAALLWTAIAGMLLWFLAILVRVRAYNAVSR
jgi:hypothetical protein